MDLARAPWRRLGNQGSTSIPGTRGDNGRSFFHLFLLAKVLSVLLLSCRRGALAIDAGCNVLRPLRYHFFFLLLFLSFCLFLALWTGPPPFFYSGDFRVVYNTPSFVSTSRIPHLGHSLVLASWKKASARSRGKNEEKIELERRMDRLSPAVSNLQICCCC